MTFAMTQAEIIELLASIQSRAGKKLSRKLEKAIILSKSEKLTSKKLLQTLANPEKKQRPPSPWHLFLQDFREGDEMEPGMTGAEVAKAASEPWSNLSVDEKKNYENKALFLRNKFYEEHNMYSFTDDKSPLGEQYGMGRGPAIRGRPKKPRPKTAWMFFLKDYRINHSGLTNHLQIQKAGEEWKEASPNIKNVYMNQAINEKNNWQQEKDRALQEVIKNKTI
jgi:hypothetical protein